MNKIIKKTLGRISTLNIRGVARKTVLAAAIAMLIPQAVYSVEPLTVSGNKVLSGGVSKSFAGMSLFWSNNGWGGEKFYNASTVSKLKSDWGATVVRAAMGVEKGGGYLDDRNGNKNKVKAVVDAAIANDIYVIVDWHTHHAENYTGDAISFFEDMARTYGKHDNIIYEIYNEPLQVSWSGTIKPYAEAVVSAIRAIDPDNLIIVGTPNWSQDVDAASYDPIRRNNIAYTLHFYAGSHFGGLRDKAQLAMNNGIALFATEWGTVNANGNGAVDHGSTDDWMTFLRRNGISHANWAVNDKSEGASTFYPGGSWDSLTESGQKAKDIIKNWGTSIGSGGGSTGGNGGGITEGNCGTVSIPGNIDAENFCELKGIKFQATSDEGAGENLGWVDPGDWIKYRIKVPYAGRYKVSYRVASEPGGGVIQLEKAGGSPVYGVIDVDSTGGWQNWKTISHVVELPAGDQVIALSAPSGKWNLNWIDVESTQGNEGNNSVLRIEAEKYGDMQGIQLENTSDSGGGRNVGWTDSGDWMSYYNLPIPPSDTGAYEVSYRVASTVGSGEIQLEKPGGSQVYGKIDVPNTNGWQNWKTISHQVYIPAGSSEIAISVPSGMWNLNWIDIKAK